MAEQRQRQVVLTAGAESGAFTIWRELAADGAVELIMTGSLADGSPKANQFYFPETRARHLAALVEELEELPGWYALPYFNPLIIDPSFFSDLDRVFAARHPAIWRERRARWLARVAGDARPSKRPRRRARSLLTRRCGLCRGALAHTGGRDRSSEERAGNPSQSDRFQCGDCGHRFLHHYQESFDGDRESWTMWTGGKWVVLERERWPT